MLTGAGNHEKHVRSAPSLGDCEREPIHIPGSIQPHGILLVLAEPSGLVIQASENLLASLDRPAEKVVGHPLREVLGSEIAHLLLPALHDVPHRTRPRFLRTITLATAGGMRTFHAVAHRAEGGVVLELELAPEADAAIGPMSDIHPNVDAFTAEAEAARTVSDLCQGTAAAVRRLTEFDRVLIYRFDEDWNGTVVGEHRNERLPSYLHHRFPASDIPSQARELYRVSRVRIIPNANYRPVPVVPVTNPTTGRPLDMSFAALRSVSPVHIEYMRNMGTAASMSVSILRDGKLWGLISCHHAESKLVSFAARTACDLIARAFSLRLSALELAEHAERRDETRTAYAKLLSAMADRGDFADALHENPEHLLAFAGAAGAAIVTGDRCLLTGKTPTESQVRQLATWLFETVRDEVFSTDSLASLFPPAAKYTESASGLLAIAVSKLHTGSLMWFRPEVVRTVPWGGDPNINYKTGTEHSRLHPRKSFETWKETVREKSQPWSSGEIEGAAELRNSIVGIVLRRAEELADLNAELTRSNRELEAFSYSVSHDLRAPLRHIVGYAEMLRETEGSQLSDRAKRCVSTIIESSEYAGILVDKLLGYSRLGRSELQMTPVDMNLLVRETRSEVMRDAVGRNISWQIADLPSVTADLMMLRMVVRDLLSNAVKYTRIREEAHIEIGCREEDAVYVIWVKDNGVGFSMDYVDKLFGVFQRLHRMEDFEGTGIGLANVRRVIERHGGRTWAEGKENFGATFYFTMPKLTSEHSTL